MKNCRMMGKKRSLSHHQTVSHLLQESFYHCEVHIRIRANTMKLFMALFVWFWCNVFSVIFYFLFFCCCYCFMGFCWVLQFIERNRTRKKKTANETINCPSNIQKKKKLEKKSNFTNKTQKYSKCAVSSNVYSINFPHCSSVSLAAFVWRFIVEMALKNFEHALWNQNTNMKSTNNPCLGSQKNRRGCTIEQTMKRRRDELA